MVLCYLRQRLGFVSNNPLMKNITDYLVDEGSYEEDILLGKISFCLSVFYLLRLVNSITVVTVTGHMLIHIQLVADLHSLWSLCIKQR